VCIFTAIVRVEHTVRWFSPLLFPLSTGYIWFLSRFESSSIFAQRSGIRSCLYKIRRWAIREYKSQFGRRLWREVKLDQGIDNSTHSYIRRDIEMVQRCCSSLARKAKLLDRSLNLTALIWYRLWQTLQNLETLPDPNSYKTYKDDDIDAFRGEPKRKHIYPRVRETESRRRYPVIDDQLANRNPNKPKLVNIYELPEDEGRPRRRFRERPRMRNLNTPAFKVSS